MDRAVAAAYERCARVVRREARSFRLAFATLPKAKRHGVYAVYAFCREADDLVDGEAAEAAKRQGLAELRARLAAAAEGTPLVDGDLALTDAIGRFSLDPIDLRAIIDGVEQDLALSRYPTFGELARYCRLVASSAGLAILPILAQGRRGGGLTRDDRRLACELGVAMQLVNIVRDVKEDLERDRVYLPQEDLVRFGVSEAELHEGRMTQGMRELLAFESERARVTLRRGAGLVRRLSPREGVCPALLAATYSRVLDRVEERGYDVFSSRVRLSPWEKLWISLSTLRDLVWR